MLFKIAIAIVFFFCGYMYAGYNPPKLKTHLTPVSEKKEDSSKVQGHKRMQHVKGYVADNRRLGK